MKKYYSLFFNDIFLSIISVIFIGYINYFMVSCYKSNYIGTINGDFAFLGSSLTLTLYIFIFLTFVSYYYIDKARSDGALECIASEKYGFFKLIIKQLAVLFTILAFIYVNIAVHNIVAYLSLGSFHAEAFVHIIQCITFYLLAVPAGAILLGCAAALYLKRFTAIFMLLLWCVLISPISAEISAGIYMTDVKFDPFVLYDFMSQMPRRAGLLPDFDMGYSLLPHRLSANAFFIFLFAAVILIKILKDSKKTRTVSAVVCGAFAVLCFGSYLIPAYEVPTAYSPKDPGAYDSQYYKEYGIGSERYEEADFRIVSYDMRLDIGRQLNARVEIKTEGKIGGEYTFTLYHDFIISKVEDVKEVNLKYEQNGDYVTVYNSTESDTIVFYYSGVSQYFFANYQGAVLSGAFAYYPKAGRLPMFYKTAFYKTLSDYPIEFRVTVNSNDIFYSNLEREKGNEFYGISDGVSLYSGFLDTIVINGKEVIYPYINTEQCAPENLQRYIDILDGTGYGDIKRIIIVPNQRLGKYMNIFLHSDGTIITAHTVLFNSRTALEQSKYISYKLPLLSALETYQNDPAYFKSVFEVISLPDYETNGTKDIYYLVTEAVNATNFEIFKEEANRYIIDNNDKRTVSEFIKDYTEGR